MAVGTGAIAQGVGTSFFKGGKNKTAYKPHQAKFSGGGTEPKSNPKKQAYDTAKTGGSTKSIGSDAAGLSKVKGHGYLPPDEPGTIQPPDA